MAGPGVRTDIVDVYVFRHEHGTGAEFLQLRRTSPPLAGTWQPVMGHILPHETATAAALRELREETGYAPDRGLRALWQLECPNVFFLASADAMMLSPCFAAWVDPQVEPVLDASHDAVRWIPRDRCDRDFLWPGQRQAIDQIVRDLLPPGSPVAPILRVV